jgi:hypothetical protein
MSFHQPPPPPQQPPYQQPPFAAPAPPTPVPGWARKRVLIPVAAFILIVGVGIGSAGGGGTEKTSADPAPTVTKTVGAAAESVPEPAPTVTVTETAKAKTAPKEETATAPEGKAVFKVWGSAPNGVDITYGSDGTNLEGSRLPMTKTLTVDEDSLYYQVSAQLTGGGDVQCSVTIDGKTKTGRAKGSYNICSAQLNGDFSGGFS